MRAPVLALLTAAMIVPGSALAKPTASFLQDAIRGDNSEMRLGALAATRGRAPSLRAFGRTLERDHTRAKADAVAMARRVGMAPPATMMPEAAREYRLLSTLRGGAFDREFARYMVADHRKDIAEFEQQVRTGRDGTAALARRTLPHLRAHLRLASSLA